MAWYQRVWNVLRAGGLHRDLERELEFHLAERIDELCASGLSEEEAARLAAQQLGGLGRQVERTRDMDINAWFDSVLRNVRYSVRTLARTPGFTATVVLTLALGIGANSAVFSAIYAVLLRPLPYPNPNRLVRIVQSSRKTSQPFVAPIRLEEWNSLNTTLTAISGYYLEDISEMSGELPEKLKSAAVAPRFLQVLGVAPALGRDFSLAEEHYGGPSAILISDRLWHRRFGGDPHAIGRSLRITGWGVNSVTIVGVMPPSFAYPDADVDIWSPSPPDAPFAQDRNETWYTGVGRLKPDVTVSQARENLAAVQAGLGRQFPKPDAELSVSIEPLKEVAVGGIRKSLLLLFGSVSLLLLIACTNIAALLLSRAVRRRHEISIRFSLGASRASVMIQLLTEVLVLAISGSIIGLVLAAGASRVFARLAKDLPRVGEITLDGRVVMYALVCAVAATLLCGILPAIRGTRDTLAASLSHGSRTQVSGRMPLQFVLVGIQVALAVTLLVGAGVLLRSFQELGRVSPGFNPQHVLTFHISSSYAETNDQKAANQRTRRLLEGLESLPGVESATTAIFLPGVPNEFPVELKTTEGRADTEPKLAAEERWVTPEYFATLRIPLVAGEMCRDQAGRFTAMVNRSFASKYFNGTSVIGHHIVQPGSLFVPPAEVRGIVGDARETGIDHEPVPTAYWCAGTMQPGTYFLVRTHGDPMTIASAVRHKVHELEPLRSVYDMSPLTEHISDAYAENRLRTVLLVFFALTAIALASIGLYGTLSYLVNVRQREVALRMALGALRGQVVRQFVTQGLLVAIPGTIVGLALAAASRRLISGMLYGVTVTDASALAAVVAIVLAVSLAASLIPAIRAARLQPMTTLREQ